MYKLFPVLSLETCRDARALHRDIYHLENHPCWHAFLRTYFCPSGLAQGKGPHRAQQKQATLGNKKLLNATCHVLITQSCYSPTLLTLALEDKKPVELPSRHAACTGVPWADKPQSPLSHSLSQEHHTPQQPQHRAEQEEKGQEEKSRDVLDEDKLLTPATRGTGAACSLGQLIPTPAASVSWLPASTAAPLAGSTRPPQVPFPSNSSLIKHQKKKLVPFAAASQGSQGRCSKLLDACVQRKQHVLRLLATS